MDDHDVDEWITAVLLREMAGLEGQATFECVESTFSFGEMHSPWERRSSLGLG